MDPEITAAFDRIAERIERRIESESVKGANATERIENKVDALTRDVSEMKGEFTTHVDWDNDRFDEHRERMNGIEDKAEQNGIGIAKVTGVATGSGGIVAFLMKLFGDNPPS